MKISVITPAYNAAKFIEEVIGSVANQTYKDIEHIIVDGGSTDGTTAILQKHPHLKWISEPDKGVYDAMNKGIAMATGDWLYFLGSDDTLYSQDTFAFLNRKYAATFKGNDVVYGDVVYQEDFRASYQHRFFNRYKFDVININHQAIFYHKSVFQTYGNFNLTYFVYGDWEMNMRLFFKKEVKTCYVPVIIANYSILGLSNQKVDTFTQEKRKETLQKHVDGLGIKEQLQYQLFLTPNKTIVNKIARLYRKMLLRFCS